MPVTRGALAKKATPVKLNASVNLMSKFGSVTLGHVSDERVVIMISWEVKDVDIALATPKILSALLFATMATSPA